MLKAPSTYYKQFVTILSGNALSQLIPFVFAPILAYYFSKAEIGEFSNFLALVSLFGIIANGRLELAIPLPEEKEKAQKIVFTSLIITSLISILVCLIPLFENQFSAILSNLTGIQNKWLIPIGVLSIGVLGVANNWLLRHKNYRLIAVSKVSQSIVNSGFAALLGFWGWGPEGLVVGWLLSQFIGVFVMWFGMQKIPKIPYSMHTFKGVLKEYKDFPVINSLHAFSDIFITQFLLFYMVSNYYGLAELGLFAYMNRLVKAPIVLITSSVSQLFYVEANALILEKKSVIPIMLKTIKTSLFFGLPFILVVYFFAPTLFEWYLGDGWGQAGVYARNITPYLLMTFIFSPISMMSILFKKQKQFFIWSMAGQLASIFVLYLGHQLQWTFADTLWLYSMVFVIYFVFLFWWYLSIAKKAIEK